METAYECGNWKEANSANARTRGKGVSAVEDRGNGVMNALMVQIAYKCEIEMERAYHVGVRGRTRDKGCECGGPERQGSDEHAHASSVRVREDKERFVQVLDHCRITTRSGSKIMHPK
jgi:hypothetical protein